MPFNESNIAPFLESYDKNTIGEESLRKDSIDDEELTPASSKVVLIHKDGKTVSSTSTGKRKFHKKSKLGCDSCKRRRVKCDEGKPNCKKCENLNIECTYSIPTDNAKKTAKKRELSESSFHETNNDTPIVSSSKSLLQEIENNSSTISNMIANNPNILSQFANGSFKLENFIGVDIPNLTLKNLSSSLPGNIAEQLSNMNPANFAQLRASMLSENSPMISRDSNNSLNLNSLSNNPTISPQPSMSPGSVTSPLSTHQQLNDNENKAYLNPTSQPSGLNQSSPYAAPKNLNLTDLKLMYHYTTVVAPTITTAGISEKRIWMEDIPQLAFNYPFLMHSILGFSATHLSRTTKGLEQSITYHRGEALRLLREAVLELSAENTDALVASALILIMDSLANASLPSSTSPTSLPASAWIFHVKGAATILTAVWPLPPTSRFYKFISVDLDDLGDIINERNGAITELVCFDESIADLYPVESDSPYLMTLAYLDKLHHEKNKSDFILRIFAFPALLDKMFLALLMSGDLTAMRIMRSYYSLLRGFTTEMKDRVWFLEGVSKVLPADVDDYTGGGGMHMMLDFLGGGLPSMTTTNLAPGLNIDINDHFMNP